MLMKPYLTPKGTGKWVHIKTVITGPANPGFKIIGGFNHIYANDKAMEGYAKGTLSRRVHLCF